MLLTFYCDFIVIFCSDFTLYNIEHCFRRLTLNNFLLSRLFSSHRKAIGGHVDRVCEGRPVHDDVKEWRSFLIDMMACQQVLVNNASASLLDSIAITQKVCPRLPFKLREKVREVASRRCKGNVFLPRPG